MMNRVKRLMNDSSDKIVGCDAVNDHISKPIPNRLWHYTSYAAFQGIVGSKKIWASEYRFLNDREEFRHAKDLAQKLVDGEPEFTGEVFPAREFLRKAVNIAFNTGYLHEERLRIMVASFSEEGDQLSQWRGYADNSRGVSIGFDLRGLRPPSNIGTTVTFAPCLYREADKDALLKAIFAHYRNGLQEWWDSIVNLARKKQVEGGGTPPQFIQQLLAEHSKEQTEVTVRCHANLQFDLLRTAPLLKDESFSEEKEWRLVLPWESIRLPTNHPIEFRPIRDALVPYIAYPLNMPNQEGPIFCADLILGPGSHTAAAIGVNMFLQKQEIRILARPSNIPYRPT
jgi:hypothetical protein